MGCCRPTTLYPHTGTTSPTDIGPATGGILHSVTISRGANAGSVVIKDGGSGGTDIFSTHLPATNQNVVQLLFKGVEIGGQLNVQMSESDARVNVEMSE